MFDIRNNFTHNHILDAQIIPEPPMPATKATITQWAVIDHEPDPELFALAIRAPLADRLAAGDVLLLHGSEGWCLSNDQTDPAYDALDRKLERIRRDLALSEFDEFRILIRCG